MDHHLQTGEFSHGLIFRDRIISLFVCIHFSFVGLKALNAFTQICNNIYKICQASTPFALAGLAFINNPYVLIWMATAISFINMSQVPSRIQAKPVGELTREFVA
jgi:hypothetical protein